MKHSVLALVAVSATAALAISPAVQARNSRTDIACPYGNGGVTWNPVAGNPLSISTGVPGATNQLFVPANQAMVTNDDVGLNITAASQYNTYAAAPPDASTCATTMNAPTALAQVMDYTLGSGNSIGSAGDIEIEFNYNSGVTSGKASFTLGGLTFTGSGLTATNESDFLFSSTGSFLGAITTASGSAALVGSTLPTGWAQATGGGGGGTVTAPELDPATTAGALGLLFAGIAVVRGRRRL